MERYTGFNFPIILQTRRYLSYTCVDTSKWLMLPMYFIKTKMVKKDEYILSFAFDLFLCCILIDDTTR